MKYNFELMKQKKNSQKYTWWLCWELDLNMFTNFNLNFWMGFQCVTVLTCLGLLWKKKDLSVLMINDLIKIVKIIYKWTSFCFLGIWCNFSKNRYISKCSYFINDCSCCCSHVSIVENVHGEFEVLLTPTEWVKVHAPQ